jgi:uncharacterized integral membrane protein (TIGR00698 family)
MNPLQRSRALGAGLGLCALIAALAHAAAGKGWSPVVIALMVGLLLGQCLTAQQTAALGPGLNIAKKHILRAGVVLYALHIDFAGLAHGGLQIVIVDACVLITTFALARWLGPRLGLSGAQSALIGAGSSICGVSAILASAAVVRARSEEIAMAVATITLFGTAAFLLHPWLWRLNVDLQVVSGGAAGYGVYIGATVHDVAQVVATALAVEPRSVDAALVAKMGRVAMLAPFLILLARHARIDVTATDGDDPLPTSSSAWKSAMVLPVLCLVAAAIGTALPREALTWANGAAGLCLATAVAGLGISTRLGALLVTGRKALLLGAVLLAWLIAGGALIHALAEGIT